MRNRYKPLKKLCVNCSACASICPKSCIAIKEDEYGFGIPVIETSQCISCNLCEKVCPALNPLPAGENGNIFVTRNNEKTIFDRASSGGLFALFAHYTIDRGGVVFGARFDEEWKVKHGFAETHEGLEAFFGSKYVQSNVGSSFKEVKTFLLQNRLVLFSGTPCQVAGLKKFLKKDYANLLTLDFICHGVPNPKVFRTYLAERLHEEAKKHKVEHITLNSIHFRDKTLGWKRFGFGFGYSYKDHDGHTVNQHSSVPLDVDLFMKGFLSDIYLRPSCYNCPTKNFTSQSDITLADAWGIWEETDRFDDDKGASLIFVHSQAGERICRELSDKMEEPFPVDKEFILKHNPAAFHSAKPHKSQRKFYRLFTQSECSFEDILNQCLPPPTYFDKLVWSINRRIKALCKK